METPLRLLPLESTQAHSHHEQNKIQTDTFNLTQCDCLYPCPFHITSFFHGYSKENPDTQTSIYRQLGVSTIPILVATLTGCVWPWE